MLEYETGSADFGQVNGVYRRRAWWRDSSTA